DRPQERPLEQERAREDVARDVLPVAALRPIRLDAEELLLVVPLEERARLVETLVALEADELRVEDLRQHLAALGLARARGTFGEERLLEREGEEERCLDPGRRDVAGGAQPLAHLLDGHPFLISAQARDAHAIEETVRTVEPADPLAVGVEVRDQRV